MSNSSNIEWTDASWNCLAGCEAISPGCAHCYAASMTRRLEAMGQQDYAGLTTAKHFNGKVRCLPHKLDVPLRWRKPRRVFVNSMSDLFHEDVPDTFIDKVFAVMAICQQHTFQVLTKRAERMAAYFSGWKSLAAPQHAARTATACGAMQLTFGEAAEIWSLMSDSPLPNVWLGVSCEDQQRADERIPRLLKTPAAVRFVSAEPLLGGINFGSIGEGRDAFNCLDGIGGPNLDWVIVGGESGSGARPCDVAWIRSIVSQCKAAGVECFVKQLGSRPQFLADPMKTAHASHCGKGGDPAEWPEDLRVREFPHAAAHPATTH